MDSPDLPRAVLVLGAGGFLGEHIAQQLAASGCEVVAAVRPGAGRDFSTPVTVLEGDLLDRGFVRGALDGVEAIVFAAGRTWRLGLDPAQCEHENVEIARRFFEALGRRPEVRVVFTSSLATIAGSRAPFLFTEDSGRHVVCEPWLSPYARAKIVCERLALDAADRGNQIVILNPGQLLGPGVTPASNLATAFALLWLCQGRAPFAVRGGTTYSDVRDVARAHVTALRRGRSGQRYILGGHCLDRSQFYAHVSALTGVRAPWGLSAGMVYLGLALADAAAVLSRGRLRNPVHRSFARGEGLHYFGTSEKAGRELGYTVTPLEVTILDTLRHYHLRGLLPPHLDFVGSMMAEDAPAFLLLSRLARKSHFSGFLLARLGRVREICRSNHALRAALARLLEADRPGGVPLSRRQRAADRKVLLHFFEYLYFASDEFLRRVE